MRPPESGRQRRRFPRLEIDGTLQLHDETLGRPIHIRDIGLGGFQSALPVPVAVGDVHHFSATIGRQFIELTAAVVYCRAAVGSQPRFIVGWQLSQDAATRRAITQVLDQLTSVDVLLGEAIETRKTQRK